MDQEKSNLLREIKFQVGQELDLQKEFSDEEIEELIAGVVFRKAREHYLNSREKEELIRTIFNSMRRLDVIQPLLEDPGISEIMVNGPENIFVERQGRVSRLELAFENSGKLEDVIQSIVAKVNRTVNEASPIVDARLPDGSRVSVVLQPIALNGPILTIRKFPDQPLSLEELISLGSLTQEAGDTLKAMVMARFNIFISGGTGSGKTTFLNALSNYIPHDERIVTIEDSAELQIMGVTNTVRLETRNPNTEGKGLITIRELIRTSLRMRPDRIIVGEVRGAEALDMLQAMNTGHDGSLSTGHANSSYDLVSRLETMVLSGAAMPLEAIRQQIASALDIIVQLARLRDKTRRVIEISEVVGYEGGQIILNPLYSFREKGEDGEHRILGALERTSNQLRLVSKFTMAGIPCPGGRMA